LAGGIASSTTYGLEFDNVAQAINPTGPVSISPVPEPKTYAMLLARLAMVGTMVRRRTSSALDQIQINANGNLSFRLYFQVSA
jgi:hypothetical protein